MSVFKPINSKKFHYRFMLENKIYTGSTFTSNKATACAFERQKKEELYGKVYLGDTKKKQITINDAIQEHLNNIRQDKEYSNHVIYAKKMRGIKRDPITKQDVYVHKLDVNKPLHELTTRDVMHLIQARREEGNGPSTILYELVVLNQIIKHAKRMEYVVPSVDFAQIKKDAKLKPNKGRIRYLTVDEEVRLLNELSRTDLPGVSTTHSQRLDTLHFVTLLLDVACRHTEMATLQWKDVDLTNKTIRLYRSKVNNESMLSLSDRAVDVLKQRDAQRKPSDVYVFTAEDGTARKYAPKAFKSACQRAGLDDVSFHVLRHTACTRLVQAGMPLYAIQQIVGHSTMTTTQRYSHLSPSDASAAAVEIMNRINRNTVSG